MEGSTDLSSIGSAVLYDRAQRNSRQGQCDSLVLRNHDALFWTRIGRRTADKGSEEYADAEDGSNRRHGGASLRFHAIPLEFFGVCAPFPAGVKPSVSAQKEVL